MQEQNTEAGTKDIVCQIIKNPVFLNYSSITNNNNNNNNESM